MSYLKLKIFILKTAFRTLKENDRSMYTREQSIYIAFKYPQMF